MSRRQWLPPAVALFLAVASSSFGNPILPPEAQFKTRTGIVNSNSIRDIIENPTELEFSISARSVGAFHVIRTESDYHVLFPAPAEKVLAVLLDYEGMKKTYRRVKESYLVDSADAGPWSRRTVRTDLSVSVLGFGDTYSYITNNWVARDNAGAYVQKYNLEKSVDDKLYEMLGNWYVKEINLDGKVFTYVRQYTILGIQHGSWAMELAIRAFGAGSIRRQLNQLMKATVAR